MVLSADFAEAMSSYGANRAPSFGPLQSAPEAG
jgi:hypothetical protein